MNLRINKSRLGSLFVRDQDNKAEYYLVPRDDSFEVQPHRNRFILVGRDITLEFIEDFRYNDIVETIEKYRLRNQRKHQRINSQLRKYNGY